MDATILRNQPDRMAKGRPEKIVVAYDASPSAERALNAAIVIGRQFNSEILIVQAISPDEAASSSTGLRDERTRDLNDIEEARRRITKAGLSSRGIVRNGIVGDVVFSVCCEEHADLLVLGAYGYGLQDRPALGSTAEYLLRSVPCPTLTFGPIVSADFDLVAHQGPILVPVSLPCGADQLQQAIVIAKLFSVKLEILHIAEHAIPTVIRDLESQCEQLIERVRCGGANAQWSFYIGAPDRIILQRAVESDSPFVLMPLRWGHRLSSVVSDNVAAHVIRSSTIPVMTYRVD